MATMQQLVVAAFRDRTQAEQATHELIQSGFGHDQIRFAGHGAAAGSLLEKISNLFTGRDHPSGQNISGNDITNNLVDMGTPLADARYYQSEFEAGRSVVTVLARERAQEAADILARHGGYGAGQRSTQATGMGTAASTQTPGMGTAGRETATSTQTPGMGTAASMQAREREAAAAAGRSGTVPEDEQTLKLREEELRVSKQPIETGEVRIHKEVVTEQKTVDVPVSHEEVYIEHRAASGEISDTPIGEGETYRIPVREEQIKVEKQPVEREEVVFGKQTVQESKRVSDTVQREEARIEREGKADIDEESDIEHRRNIHIPPPDLGGPSNQPSP